MRIVADTNVLVSASIFPGGPPEVVYRLVLEERVGLVTSRPLLAELGRVLTEKFGWQPQHAEEAVEQVIRLAEIVEPRETLTVVAADQADDRVLEAAAEGEVDAIVSGDRHLLELEEWRKISIQSPAVFLADVDMQDRQGPVQEPRHTRRRHVSAPGRVLRRHRYLASSGAS